MEFYNLEREKNKISEAGILELDTVLDAVIALFKDVETGTNTKLKNGTAGNYKLLNTRINAVSKILCDLYDDHRDEIQRYSQKTFTGNLRAVEKETLEIKTKLLDMEDELEKQSRIENDLKESRAREKEMLRELAAQKTRIEDQTAELEKTIRQRQSIDIPALKAREKTLTDEKIRLEKEKTDLDGRIGQLQTDVAKAKDDCGCKNGDCDRLAGELQVCREKLAAALQRQKGLEAALTKAGTDESAAIACAEDLTGKITASQSRLGTLNTQIAAKAGELEQTNNTITAKETEYTKLAGILSEAGIALAEAVQKVAAAQKDIDDTNASIAWNREELGKKQGLHQQLQKSLEDLCGKIRDEDAAIEKLTADIQAAQQMLAGKQQKHNALKGSIDDLNERIRVLDQSNELLAAREAALREEVERLLREKTAALARIKELEKQKADLCGQLNAARVTITDLEQQIADIQAQLAECRSRIAELTAQLEKLAAELEPLRAEEEHLAALAAEALERKAELQAKIAEHTKTLEELAGVDSDIKQADENLAKAKANLNDAVARRDGILAQITQAQKDLADLQTKCAELSGQYQTADAKRLEQQTLRDGLIDSLAKAQTQTAALEKQVAALQTELDKTNADAETCRGRITQLEADIAAAEQTHEDLVNQNAALEQELQYQQERNAEYRVDPLQTTEGQLTQAKNEYTALTAQLEDMKKKQKDLGEQRKKVDGDISRTNSIIRMLLDKFAESKGTLEQRQEEYQGKKDELDEINRKIGILADELKPLQKEIDDANALLESWDPVTTKAKYEGKKADLDKKLAELAAIREEIPRMSAELTEKRIEYTQLRDQQNTIRDEHQSLCRELDRLNDPKVLGEVDRLNARNQVLHQIRGSVLSTAKALCVESGSVSDLVDLDLKYVGSTLNTLRDSINGYASELEKKLNETDI